MQESIHLPCLSHHPTLTPPPLENYGERQEGIWDMRKRNSPPPRQLYRQAHPGVRSRASLAGTLNYRLNDSPLRKRVPLLALFLLFFWGGWSTCTGHLQEVSPQKAQYLAVSEIHAQKEDFAATICARAHANVCLHSRALPHTCTCAHVHMREVDGGRQKGMQATWFRHCVYRWRGRWTSPAFLAGEAIDHYLPCWLERPTCRTAPNRERRSTRLLSCRTRAGGTVLPRARTQPGSDPAGCMLPL